MKHPVIAGAIMFMATCLVAQETKVPAAARQSFANIYPAATHIKWEKADADYEVKFMLGTRAILVTYDAAGVLKKTEALIEPAELPGTVMAYIKKHYKNMAVKDAAKITKANGEVNYEAAVGKADLTFDQHGKLLKQVKD